MDGWMDGWVGGWMGGCVDGGIGGWVDGWVDGWMDDVCMYVWSRVSYSREREFGGLYHGGGPGA